MGAIAIGKERHWINTIIKKSQNSVVLLPTVYKIAYTKMLPSVPRNLHYYSIPLFYKLSEVLLYILNELSNNKTFKDNQHMFLAASRWII